MTKYIVFLSAVLFTGFYTEAQITKSTVMLGGSIGYHSLKPPYNNPFGYTFKERSFSISPSIGWVVKDNLVLGADLSFSQTTIETGSKTRYYEKGAGLFIRKYWEVANRLYVFGQGRLGMEFSNKVIPPKVSTAVLHQKETSASLTVTPGIAFAVSKKVQLESTLMTLLSLNYAHTKTRLAGTSGKPAKKDSFGLNSTLSNSNAISVGVKVLLSK